MIRKIFIIAVSVIVLALLAGLLYVFLVPKTAITIENGPSAEGSAKPELKSFRGVLADVLDGIRDEISEIEEVVANHLAGDEKKAAENTPALSGENNFTFAILGDTQRFNAGNPNGNFQKAVKNISQDNVSLVFAMGDLVSSCEGDSKCVQKFSDWKKVLGSLMSKTYATMGNHDRIKADADKAWDSSFDFPLNGPSGYKEMTYSFDYANSHFVVLDSDAPGAHKINDTQRTWLEKDLTGNKEENIFVVFHEPAYPVSDKATESLDVYPSERNALWQIFEKYNVAAVFNGHEHIVSRRKIGKVYQFVFGSTDSFDHGLPAAGVAEYASQGQGRFGIVKVNGNEITVETHDSNGKLLNTFTFSK